MKTSIQKAPRSVFTAFVTIAVVVACISFCVEVAAQMKGRDSATAIAISAIALFAAAVFGGLSMWQAGRPARKAFVTRIQVEVAHRRTYGYPLVVARRFARKFNGGEAEMNERARVLECEVRAKS